MRGLALTGVKGPAIARMKPSALTLPACTLGFVVALTHAAFALDGNKTADSQPPLKEFSSVDDALRDGLDDLRAGNSKSSVKALTYAAEGGQPLAQWKLGRMYATGDGVAKDEVKAYHFYESVVDGYDEDEPNRRNAPAISNAYVALGQYFLSGIAGSEVKADPERAAAMFREASVNFGDPDAQFHLARMYMDGAGGLPKSNMQAVRWLNLAAQKGHHAAQAQLGDLLFVGDGVPRQRARGLMWLMMAKNSVASPKDEWMRDLFTKDFAMASQEDRDLANLYRDQRMMALEQAAPPRTAWSLNGLAGIFPPIPRLFGAAPPPDFDAPPAPPPGR